MSNPFEKMHNPESKPENPKVWQCPHCGGKGKNANGEPCKPCDGTGKARDKNW